VKVMIRHIPWNDSVVYYADIIGLSVIEER